MDGHVSGSGDQFENHGEGTQRSPKRKGRKTARPVDAQGKNGWLQVTTQVPRDVMAVYDHQADVTGVNRQHLIREALTLYAGILEAGCRVYQVPGHMQERAA